MDALWTVPRLVPRSPPRHVARPRDDRRNGVARRNVENERSILALGSGGAKGEWRGPRGSGGRGRVPPAPAECPRPRQSGGRPRAAPWRRLAVAPPCGLGRGLPRDAAKPLNRVPR